MAQIPYSRVVDVSVTRQDRFPSQRGFSTALLLTGTALATKVDSTTRTKLYSSIDEVSADGWATNSPAYLGAQAFFSGDPRPIQLKIGFVDIDGTPTMASEIAALNAFDSDWYWGCHTSELVDSNASQKALATWFETQNKIVALDSADADTKTAIPATDSSIAKWAKDSALDRCPVFYHPNAATQLLGPRAWAYTSGRNLDRANYEQAKRGRIDSGQAYTLKFKELRGATAADLTSADVQAITGFVPGSGLVSTAGNYANTYINIGGLNMLVEGSTPRGSFIDEIHAVDWLRARMQESVLAALANEPRIPMTDVGVGFLIQAGVVPTLNRAVAAGILAVDFDESGRLLPPYEITVDKTANIPAQQRRQRIAPDIKVIARFAGAIHYASVSITLKF